MSFVDADPIPLVLRHLTAHPRVLDEFGGPEHITGIREDPWPHLEVTPGDGGNIRNIRAGGIDVPVDFVVWGHPDGRHGKADLRRLTLVVIEACLELEENDYTPGDPVISVAKFDGHPTDQTLSNGQRRWQFSGQFTTTPPTPVAP